MKMTKQKNPEKKEENQNHNEEDFKKQIEDLKAQTLRVLADYDNLKKRTESEKEIWSVLASARVVGRMLPILDTLVSAQTHLNDQGLAIVLELFKNAIKDEGFEEINIEVDKTDFDSKLMEVVEAVNTEEKNLSGKVKEVVLGGWKAKNNQESNERFVIRPAKVKVYKNDAN
jgi:molecular chaperone GrpE